ncbi:MAG TPA: hypothetical protein VD861_07265 [Pyrinomonadaceae bacterium]|jgi:hypothetical protein|nr:hypothetical protein [Pyrinomonadaceae bacterium]
MNLRIHSNFSAAGDPPIIISGGLSARQPESGSMKSAQQDPPIIVSGG